MKCKPRSATREYLLKFISYDPETGVFTWQERQKEDFKTENFRVRWNQRNAGKPAGWPLLNGYWCIDLRGERYPAHRLAWFLHYGYWPENDVDHINNQRQDNRIANLREATRSQNLQNASIRSNNTSGHKNVSYRKDTGKWTVRMWKFKVKYLSIGSFDTLEEAITAATKAREELYKEFANHG